jgi:L-asparagine transporter-like permease
MPLFPGMQIAGLILLSAVLITMGLDKEVWGISWLVGVPWLLFISLVYFIVKARRGRSAVVAAASAPDPVASSVGAKAGKSGSL